MRLSERAIRERLLVVAKAPAEALLHRLVERVLAGVPERRVPHVVTEPDRLDQVFIQTQRPRDDARDRRRLERVGHASPVVVAVGIDEDLRLSLQSPERLRVNDAVAVALELRAYLAWLLRKLPPPGLERSDCEPRQPGLQLQDALLEAAHQMMIGDGSTVRAPRCACHVRSAIGAEEDDYRRDLLRPRETPERSTGADLREHLVALALLVRKPAFAEPRVGLRSVRA